MSNIGIILFSAALFSMNGYAFAQNERGTEKNESDSGIENEEKVIGCYWDAFWEFPGGMAAMLDWAKKNIRLPEGFTGGERVIVKFTIQPDGKVTDGKIIKGSANEALNEEALRLISIMPDFKISYPVGAEEKPVLVNWPVVFQQNPVKRIIDKKYKRD